MARRKIPNALTILRIILFIPVVSLVASTTPIVYVINWSSINLAPINVSAGMVAAGVLFVLASVSDWLDGYLARKWKVISDFGKLWDPIADKVLINALLITFAALNLVHFGLVIIFIVRDIVMDGLRMYALRYDVVVAANIYGKLKTVFQMVACLLTFFIFALPLNGLRQPTDFIWFWVGQMFFYWIAIIFAISSWAIYYFKIIKMMKLHNELVALRSSSSKLKS